VIKTVVLEVLVGEWIEVEYIALLLPAVTEPPEITIFVSIFVLVVVAAGLSLIAYPCPVLLTIPPSTLILVPETVLLAPLPSCIVALLLFVATFDTVLPEFTLTVTLLAKIKIALPLDPPVLMFAPFRFIVGPGLIVVGLLVKYKALPDPVLLMVPTGAFNVPLPATVNIEDADDP